MALIFTEGFDTYGNNNGTAVSPTGIMSRRGWTIGSDNTSSEAGRVAGGAVGIAGNSYIRKDISGTETTKTIGFAFKYVLVSALGTSFIALRDGGTNQVVLALNATGNIEVRRNTTVLATSSTTLILDTWYYIELQTTIDNTTGAYDLMIDGVTDVSATSVDTQNTANTYWDRIHAYTATFTNDTYRIDDLYVTDTTGANNTGFLGPIQIDTIRPTGDVTTDWTALGAGSHYVEVDENPVDDDTSYVESNTVTDRELYDMGDTGAGSPTIFGVTSIVDARNTDATTHNIQLVNKSSTTTTVSSSKAVGSVSASKFEEITEQNPDTSTAWTKTTIDAAQFGFEVA